MLISFPSFNTIFYHFISEKMLGQRKAMRKCSPFVTASLQSSISLFLLFPPGTNFYQQPRMSFHELQIVSTQKKERAMVCRLGFSKKTVKYSSSKHKAILVISGVPLLVLNVLCSRKRKKRRKLNRGY